MESAPTLHVEQCYLQPFVVGCLCTPKAPSFHFHVNKSLESFQEVKRVWISLRIYTYKLESLWFQEFFMMITLR